MSEGLLDAAGRRRSPATLPGFHAGRAPCNTGQRYPADPPTVEEIVAVVRAAEALPVSPHPERADRAKQQRRPRGVNGRRRPKVIWSAMHVSLFTDLNCPFCYATEQRLEELGVSDRIVWRGVEHEPDLPVPMAIDDLEIAAELAEEVQSVRGRAPEVAIAVPPGKANTAAGLLATAAALRIDAVRGAAFRQAVYRAFWRDGRDVSDAEVLEGLAREHGLPALRTSPEDALTVASWRLAWERSPLRGVPLLIRDDGETVYGLKDVETLARFVQAG